MIQRILALVLFIFCLPLLAVLYIIVKLDSRGPFVFKQLRAGKNKKPFTMFKIRTMVGNAEQLRSKIQHLNEVERPAFKIRNDPRYTRAGKWISHLALDEIMQFVNVIKGEMALVGPRPLPVREANKVPDKYSSRFTVLPGITSSWIIKGAHKLGFQKWMELDCTYVKEKSDFLDTKIFVKTVLNLIKGMARI